ncbi:MAG: hypothetical protein IJ501_01125 [Bacilli bacterium]|nr:hypothetical protein [Bacilli bacterium]MBQ8472085.1 hypothetical protein [Bacilli bacterium]
MIINLQQILLQIILWILKFIDSIINILFISKSFDNAIFKGENINIIEYFLNSSIIEQVFWDLFIISIGLLVVFSIITIIKIMVKNHSTPMKIVGRLIGLIIVMILVLIVVIMGVSSSKIILELVNKILNIDLHFSFSKLLLENSINEWYQDYSYSDIDLGNVKALFGDYEDNVWLHNGMINPDTFNYLPCLITSSIVLISFLIVIIRIIKKIYEVIVLYLIMPPSISTIIIDDGLIFKNWVKEFIKRFLLAYMSVLGINLLIYMLPFVVELDIDGLSEVDTKILKLIIVASFSIGLVTIQKAFDSLMKNKRNDFKVINKIDNYQNIINNQLLNKTHRYSEEGGSYAYNTQKYEN